MTPLDALPPLPLTAAQYERLPPIPGLRLELWEGNLDVAAAAQMAWHTVVGRIIERVLLHGGQETLREIGVVLGPRTVREPDVTRFRPGVVPALRLSQFPAADVDLVVEIVSPESDRRDREVKPDEYAGAGIPEYWIVGQHPDDEADAMINMYRLTPAGRYGLARTVSLSELRDSTGD